jgi:hypothetical protein
MKRTALIRRTPLAARQKPLRNITGFITSTLKPGKPLRQTRSTGKATAVESALIELVKRLGCICCMLNRTWGMPAAYVGVCEAHHLLSGGRRRGHDATIGLCRWHHQAVPPRPMHEREAIALYGPSVATGSKPFHAMYGSDDELLAFQNALLAQVLAVQGNQGGANGE